MYQLPLKFIEVSPDVAICATRVVAIMSTKAYQARETIKAERKAGTLINGCGNRGAESCIFLDNGSVVSSPYKIKRLLKKIDKATDKGAKGTKFKNSDLVNAEEDEEPDEIDRKIDEMLRDIDEEEEESMLDEDEFANEDEDEDELDVL